MRHKLPFARKGSDSFCVDMKKEDCIKSKTACQWIGESYCRRRINTKANMKNVTKVNSKTHAKTPVMMAFSFTSTDLIHLDPEVVYPIVDKVIYDLFHTSPSHHELEGETVYAMIMLTPTTISEFNKKNKIQNLADILNIQIDNNRISHIALYAMRHDYSE